MKFKQGVDVSQAYDWEPRPGDIVQLKPDMGPSFGGVLAVIDTVHSKHIARLALWFPTPPHVLRQGSRDYTPAPRMEITWLRASFEDFKFTGGHVIWTAAPELAEEE